VSGRSRPAMINDAGAFAVASLLSVLPAITLAGIVK
jgi:hypothetical protein